MARYRPDLEIEEQDPVYIPYEQTPYEPPPRERPPRAERPDDEPQTPGITGINNAGGGGGGGSTLLNGMTPQMTGVQAIGSINDVGMVNQAGYDNWLKTLFGADGAGGASSLLQTGMNTGLANAGSAYDNMVAQANALGSIGQSGVSGAMAGLQNILGTAGQYNSQIANMLAGQQGAGLNSLAGQYGSLASQLQNNNYGASQNALGQKVGGLADYMAAGTAGNGLNALAGQYGNQANALLGSQAGQNVQQFANQLGQTGNRLMNQVDPYASQAAAMSRQLGNTGNVNNFVNQMTGQSGLLGSALQNTNNFDPNAASSQYLSQQQGIAQMANQMAGSALSDVYGTTRSQAQAASDAALRQASSQLANAGLLNTGAGIRAMTQAAQEPMLNAETQLANTRANYLSNMQNQMSSQAGNLLGQGYSNATQAGLTGAQLGAQGIGLGQNALAQSAQGLLGASSANQGQQQLGASLLGQQGNLLASAAGLNLQGQQLGTDVLGLQSQAAQAGVNAGLQQQSLANQLYGTQGNLYNNAQASQLAGQSLGAQYAGLQGQLAQAGVNAGLQGQQLGMQFANQQDQLGLNAASQLGSLGNQLNTNVLSAYGQQGQGQQAIAQLLGGLYGNTLGYGTQLNQAEYWQPQYKVPASLGDILAGGVQIVGTGLKLANQL